MEVSAANFAPLTDDQLAVYRQLIHLSDGAIGGHPLDDLLAVDLANPPTANWLRVTGTFDGTGFMFVHRSALDGDFKINVTGMAPGGTTRNARIYLGKTQGTLNLLVSGNDATVVVGDCGPPFNLNARVATNGTITIGDASTLTEVVAMVARSYLHIRKDCMLSAKISLISAIDHDIITLGPGPKLEPRKISGIRLGDHVWLGYNTHLVGSANIGSGSIVAAHAVVAGKVANNTMVAGNPGRSIKNNVTWSRWTDKFDPATQDYLSMLSAIDRVHPQGIDGPATIMDKK